MKRILLITIGMLLLIFMTYWFLGEPEKTMDTQVQQQEQIQREAKNASDIAPRSGVQIKNAFLIEGQVVDESGGKGLPGVRLTLTKKDRDEVLVSTRSARDGSFILASPEPGLYHIKARLVQWSPIAPETVYAIGFDDREPESILLKMSSERQLRFRARSEGNQPVPDAEIVLDNGIRGITSTDGLLTLPGFSSGSFRVSARGFLTNTGRYQLEDEPQIEILMKRGNRLFGQIT